MDENTRRLEAEGKRFAARLKAALVAYPVVIVVVFVLGRCSNLVW